MSFNYKGFGLIVSLQCVYNFFVVYLQCVYNSVYIKLPTQLKKTGTCSASDTLFASRKGRMCSMYTINPPSVSERNGCKEPKVYFRSSYSELVTNCNVFFGLDLYGYRRTTQPRAKYMHTITDYICLGLVCTVHVWEISATMHKLPLFVWSYFLSYVWNNTMSLAETLWVVEIASEVVWLNLKILPCTIIYMNDVYFN